MSPELLRAYIRIVVREFTIPMAGIVLTFVLVHSRQFAVWQLPLLAGMMLVPLVRLGGRAPQEDSRAEPSAEEDEMERLES